MIRQRKYYGEFTNPPSNSSSSDESALSTVPSKRKANVYDAVAGRVTQAGLIGNVADVKGSKQPLRPDEVLFKQAHAPIRYEETDYYYAHTRLPADQHLPSGDLLSALHAYISKLFSKTGEPGSHGAFRCMDETALIAFGILMEETAREVLGETGDLAFTEAADEDEERILMENDDDEEDEEDVEDVEEEEDEEKEEKLSKKTASRTGAGHAEPWSSSDDGSRYATEESD
ncbi:hypothetical protein BKA66DRAFT_412916 [Pyrenochaeta sp. MPI-SDFR-AT-0127]|nr:hypothetical protein BKA66DRAFT_412916 [Pyrenochaeta sp. MPI-SDFR-AT-0127]